jgi:polysaccharide deacetylase 2 family uncharacterized protein YibQ
MGRVGSWPRGGLVAVVPALLALALAALDRAWHPPPVAPAPVIIAIMRAAGDVPVPNSQPPAEAPPTEPFAELLEPGPHGMLPVVHAGRRAVEAYRRAAADRGDRPAVAVLVVDLGLRAELAQRSIELPGEIALAWAARADALPAWQAYARSHGHETPLMLPVEAAPGVPVDAGPGALAPGRAENPEQLAWALGRGQGYPIVVVEAGAFAATPEAFLPIARELARRGLGLLELGGRHLDAIAREAGLPYAAALRRLDVDPDPVAVDAALGQLEASALRDGLAIGWIEPSLGVFDRVWRWRQGLDPRGLALIPPSQALRGLEDR